MSMHSSGSVKWIFDRQLLETRIGCYISFNFGTLKSGLMAGQSLWANSYGRLGQTNDNNLIIIAYTVMWEVQ